MRNFQLKPLFPLLNAQQTKSIMTWKNFVIMMLCTCLYTGCQKDPIPQEPSIDALNQPESNAGFRAGSGIIQQPSSGNNCNVSSPPSTFWGAGNSTKKSWHRIVRNQTQLANAIRHVNQNGGTIFIDASFNVTTSLPTITRNNVTILSRSGYQIFDKTPGGSRASELLRVEASNFIMKNVTINGIGHLNPNNPTAWAGKRSAVVITKNNATFDRVFIRYYTHAAIRLENGSGHKVINSTLIRQNRSDLGYGVLLRNNANNVLIKRNRFDRNTHSVATTGGRNQSYRAEGNLTTNSGKWHFDVHMGPDNWGGNKVEIINNVSRGSGSLLLVRGPFADGVYVRNNLHNLSAGKLVELKPDRTFTRNGVTFAAGNFYSPFGLQRTAARAFFRDGEIVNNCINQ